MTCFKGVCRRLGLKKWPYEKPNPASGGSNQIHRKSEETESSDPDSATRVRPADQNQDEEDEGDESGASDQFAKESDLKLSPGTSGSTAILKGAGGHQDLQPSTQGSSSFDREWMRWFVHIVDRTDDEIMPAPSVWCDFCRESHSNTG